MKEKRFIGAKTVGARPMTLGDYYSHLDADLPDDEDPGEDGYLVQTKDDYEKWISKKDFEEDFNPILFEFDPDSDDLQEDRRLPRAVFPSNEKTIAVASDPDYNGAHRYQFIDSLGFHHDHAEYADSFQTIRFVQKNADGSMTPGLQSEQLLIALIDRHKKLNDKFPSPEGENAILCMEEALVYLERRVKARMERGVMGELVK